MNRKDLGSFSGGLIGGFKRAARATSEPYVAERVAAASDALDAADAVLVAGSSLMVYSGYRFCVWARQRGKPVVAVNLGRTRADPLLALKIEAPCAATLDALAARLAV